MRYTILFILLLLTACTKVIDLDLDDAEKKYVIEGSVTNQAGGCKVRISQTKNFDENNHFPGISGAIVRITDNTSGAATTLTETSEGVYEDPSFVGISGRTYTLDVNIGNGSELFTATSTMPQAVNMDTTYVSNENLFGEIWQLTNVEFSDPPGIANQYRFVQHIDGVKTKQIFINNDDISDGKRFTTKLYMEPGTEEEDKLQPNDEVQIEMMCIDAAIYAYWFSLEQGATGESENATPSNPVTNIVGGALGYFSAHTSQTKTFIVP